MGSCRGTMSCRAWLTVLAVLATSVCRNHATSSIILLGETNQTFTTAMFSVGNASDVLVDMLCIGDTPAPGLVWFRGVPSFAALPSPFNLVTTSYDSQSGFVRIYSSYIQDPDNLSLQSGVQAVNIRCFRNNMDSPVPTVNFVPVASLFFNGEFPASIPSPEDLAPLCRDLLPDLPTSTIMTVNGGGGEREEYGYCEVLSARGIFRSPSVIIGERNEGPPPELMISVQPLNITVQPINGITRGAFSCAVNPSDAALAISWYFDARSGEPMPVDINDQDVMVQFTNGTSVLVLDNVSMEREGIYHCEAVVVGSNNPLSSEPAYLEFIETSSELDQILLAPPSSLSTSEGNTLLIPCVGSVEPTFSGALIGGDSSSFGLTITADQSNNGVISCEVGSTRADMTVSVLAPLRYELELEGEVVRFLNADRSSPLLFECEVSGQPVATVSFLKNGKPITPDDNRVTVEMLAPSCSVCVHRLLRISQPEVADQGIYQCVGQIDQDSSTAIISTSYLNLQFLDMPTISYEMEPVDDAGELLVMAQPDNPTTIQLMCSVNAHPIPFISWSIGDDSPTSNSVQRITGFREPAVSTQNVVVDINSGSVVVTCTAELMGEVEITTITITPYTPVTIEIQPQANQPLIIGDTATFTCTANSVPIPTISWFRFQTGLETQLENIPDQVVIMSEDLSSTSMRSTLQLTLINEMDFAGYFCRGDNRGSIADSNISLIVSTMMPAITRDPDDFVGVDLQDVEFTCRATGLPPPNVTWTITLPLPTLPSITTTPVEGVPAEVESLLVFQAAVSLNLTTVSCVASNGVGLDATSTNATLTITGPPSPLVLSATPAARTVSIEWQTPFSLLPIMQYIVDATRESSDDLITMTIDSTLNMTSLDTLRPFSVYTVVVTAVSGAGNSTGSIVFTTLQDAPDAPPTNVVVTAMDTESILVSWDPPPLDLTNGIIVQYNITYAPIATPTDIMAVATTATEVLVAMGITPDTAYTFSVRAETVALGEPSPPIVQSSYPLPPAPLQVSPRTPDNVEVTTTTIPITLPSVNTSQFSHFWVVAVKLGDDDSLTGTPIFTDNTSFVSYSSDLPVNTPYIVSEISASAYENVISQVFVLGDENGTRTSNDFPQLYRNGPLQEGTSYVVFVWAFIPAIPAATESISKRQTEDSGRQYAVFTSSDFSLATSTQSTSPTDDDLSPGEIAGIAIAVVALVVLLVLLVVMVILLLNMWYRRVKHIGPPPTRQGSMRFKENKTVVMVMSNPGTRPDSALQDTTSDDIRLPIAVEDFPNHVRKLHANSDHAFSEEYQLITIKSPGLPHLQGSTNCNVMKNRYANINAYDETRVRLSFIPGVEGSDFINANYVEGYQKKTLYVAAQGPLPNTVHDFWRMVWEEDSCCIIMLTNLTEKGRVKCHQYWPEAGSNLGLRDLSVSVIDTQELAYYTIRTFRVAMGSERREIKQFHYTGWPDFGVPDHPHPVLSFIRRLNNFKRTTKGPDIIHCSAGVGRTGTLITIQSVMQMIEEEEGKIDIFNFILGMRRQRSYLVQTEKQYIFIHDSVLELIRTGNTEVSIQNLRQTYKELQAQNPQTETSHLEEQYLKLNSLPEVDPLMFSYATNVLNMPKNRDPNILPLDMYRVRLIMAPGVECSDYINASYVDGYQRRHQYVLTQGPMKSTVDDFWRMMWEHSVSCVLMLCQNEEKEKEMCVPYWSTDKLKQHGDLFVELTHETTFTNYTMREFSLTNTKINESRMLRHYQYTEWTEDAVPPNSAAIIDLIGVLQKAQHQNGGGPIVLHDSTPIGRAGTFCILSSVLEQLKVEGVVDLFFFIYSLRQQQAGLVATFDQYKFCYTSVLEFLDSFDHYSNFD